MKNLLERTVTLRLKHVIPNTYYNIPVRLKLVLWFAPLLLVTIGITGVYSYNVASNEIVNKMSQEQVSSAHEAIAHLLIRLIEYSDW
jgi:cytochrome b subunit of formate dehydrogenase